MKEGLNGKKKFGSIVSVYEDCPINPLVKWNDVLNSLRNGMMVFSKLQNLRIPTTTFLTIDPMKMYCCAFYQ